MSKITRFKDKIVDDLYKEVYDIIFSLEEDHDLKVSVNPLELMVILSMFYDYYESKGILYDFKEYMIGHFEDIAITAIENGDDITTEYILNGMKLFELLDSRIEVNPKETTKVIQKIREKIKKGKNSQ